MCYFGFENILKDDEKQSLALGGHRLLFLSIHREAVNGMQCWHGSFHCKVDKAAVKVQASRQYQI